jgi:RND family efflux transporter MFP subunit
VKRVLLATLAGLALAALSLNGHALQGGTGVDGAPNSPGTAPTALAVPIVDVTDTARPSARRFVGQVEPLRTVDIAFQIPGQIIELLPDEGARIAAGTAIARLDPEDHRLALDHAQAVLALAKAEHLRILELVERNVSPTAHLDRAQAELRQAEVAVEQAERHLDQTVIFAPFEALLARRLSETWGNVTPAAPVLRLQDVTQMLITISLPEELAVQVRSAPGAFHAVAQFPALPDLELPVELARFFTEADPVAQTYAVKLALQEQDERILPGMTATIELRSAAPQVRLFVPVAALDTTSGASPRIWVVAPDGTVRPRTVSPGLPEGESIEILDGLAPGERIVAAGWWQLAEGQRVQPVGP